MECVLKDLIAVSKDGEWGKGEPFDNSVEMFAIRGTDFEHVRFGDTTRVPRRYVPKRIAERKTLQPWDLVIEAAGGTKNQITGRTVLLRPQLFSDSELPFTCASFSRFIRLNTEVCDPEFVFWYLQHLYASGLMHAYHTQHTGVARFQWTTFSEREPLEIPPLPVQRRIAGILSAYDGLIENNLWRIRILEEMARSIYREWFVNFRFPGHERASFVDSSFGPIPQGWEAKKLNDVCQLTMGQSPRSEFYNETGEGLPFHQGVTDFGERFPVDRLFCTTQNRIAEAGDILFSVRAPVGRMNIADKKIIIGRGLSAIRHIASHQAFLWEQLRNRFVEDDMIGNGAIFAAVTKRDMEDIELLCPPESLVIEVEKNVVPLHDELSILTRQIHNLRQTRDLLLPRLLSGILNVSETNSPDSLRSDGAKPLIPVGEPQKHSNIVVVSTDESKSNKAAKRENTSNQLELGYELPTPIDQTDRLDVLAVIRQVFNDGQPRTRENAICDVAQALGYRRLGHRIHEVLHTDLLTAVRRGIVENVRGELQLLFRSIADYDRDFLKQQLLAAVGRSWIERDDAIQNFCRWMGFRRTGTIIDETARSLINGLLRENRIEADGPKLIRRSF